MVEVACPNCGAPVAFRSAALPASVCGFCRSAVVRMGDALTLAGQAAAVPDDVSPLRIGTRGTDPDDARAFEIIGRVRWRWSDGAWSEWLLLYADGTTAWLGEAGGRFMLLRETMPLPADADLARLLADERVIVGTSARIDGEEYLVNDARRVDYVGSEGELPFVATPGLSIMSVDLLRDDGRCASVQQENGGLGVYVGRYVGLIDLTPTGLRAIEGWPMPDYAR